MSGMNFLEKLLDGVAVEWKSFGEVAKVQRGASPRPISKFITDDENGIPWIKIGDTSPNSKYVDNTEQKITPEGAKKSRVLKKGDFIVSNSMSFGRPYILNIDGAIHDGWASISGFGDRLNADYLYHYLSSDLVQNYWISKINSGSVSNLNSDIIKSLEIPIPPLKVQAEIVRILDTFTALTAELTDRKKQYNYYHDRLLTFEKGEVEWKTLGEVALDFGRGKSKHRPRNDLKLYGGNTPFIQTGDIRNASHIIETYSQTYSEIGLKQSKLWPKGTLCITIAANIAETSILGFDACFPDSIIGFVANPEKTTSGYVEYLLSSLKTKLEEMGQGSAQSNINLGTFENLKLPFPSLIEQVRIASLLDKFDTLTHSISEGLPSEIALRQKQYEYYRDLLLSFPKTKEEQ